MNVEIEEALVASIDDALSRNTSGGAIPRSELVDTLLDLRLQLTQLTTLDFLDPDVGPRHSTLRDATTRLWHREGQARAL